MKKNFAINFKNKIACIKFCKFTLAELGVPSLVGANLMHVQVRVLVRFTDSNHIEQL